MNNNSIITFFAKHAVAATLLMVIMFVAGLWAFSKINIQLFPTFKINYATVSVVWPGGSAKDVENSITTPIELELKALDNIKEITSISSQNLSVITLELDFKADITETLSKIREKVNLVKQLPPDAEKPVIQEIETFEAISRLILSGPDDLEELKDTAFQIERELLDLGIKKITISGLPKKEFWIEIPADSLKQLKLSLPDIANIIRSKSKDASIGMYAQNEFGNIIRSVHQKRSTEELMNLDLIADENGQLIKLGDIATIKVQHSNAQPHLFYQNKPAIELTLLRAENDNTLTNAEIFHTWLEKSKPEFGESINITSYYETWQFLKERIQVLVSNGLGGLVLILIILFIFLNRNIAFWVAMGIPTSFMATLFALHLLGGSINMISLFAFIMTLGIIVDDTIVVGEQTLTNLKTKEILPAVTMAAQKMFSPIMAASLTTVAAFLPLLLISNIIGRVLREIPVVIACFIVASLIECFFILPGHLYHSFKKSPPGNESKLRKKIQLHTENFIQFKFRPFATIIIHHPFLTIVSVFSVMFLSFALVIGKHIPFNLFPSPDGKWIYADVSFHAGTPEKERDRFVDNLHKAILQTEKDFKESKLIHALVINKNLSSPLDPRFSKSGETQSSITLELSSPDERKVTNDEIIKSWKSKVSLSPNVETLIISAPAGGPPGKDIDIQIKSNNFASLKKAANIIANKLEEFDGIFNITNDIITQQQEVRYELTPQAKAMKITEADVSRQLRAAISGETVQVFNEPNEEIEIKVIAPENERKYLSFLDNYPFITHSNEAIPFQSIIDLKKITVPDHYRHVNTQLATIVTAELDKTITNTSAILAELNEELVPGLESTLGVSFDFKGKAADQKETLKDMVTGVLLGICMIYIILAWVFSSYTWPLIVMSAIPLGLAGAIIGHLVMKIDLTILSLFGLFGVSGIVVNDSIILLNEYQHLKTKMSSNLDALIEASCRRFRPVMLTSITTIAGLIPLLFETSLQAQFLIPMATSIAFGLGFATMLILLFIPSLMLLFEKITSVSSKTK